MISRRWALQLGLAVVAVGASGRAAFADISGTAAVGTVRSFYDQLLATMKSGPSLGFAGRRDRLEGVVKRAFDLPQMTRLAVGPRWRSMSPQEQAALVAAFGDYSAATYASRFTHDNGERFVVSPAVTTSSDGTIVHTQLVPNGDSPVQLDYLMKPVGGGWKIEDVYLSGTISELATRRSEFSSVLDRGGPQALVDALRRKASAEQG